MSFRDCLERAALQGMIKQEKLQEANKLLDEMERSLIQQGIDAGEAALRASKHASETIAREVQLRKIQRAANLTVTQRILSDFSTHKNWRGENDWNQAALDLFEGGKTNYTARRMTILGQVSAIWESALEKYAPKAAGFIHPTKGLDNLVRELFGEATGDSAAAGMAKSWSEATQFLIDRAQKAGSAILERTDWRLPNNHSVALMFKKGRKAWVRDMMNADLDWQRMAHPDTGRIIPIDQREDVLRMAYDTIVTDGASKIGPVTIRGRGSLANRQGAHRFIQFRTADAWLNYHGKYGEGSAFDAMTGHLESMSHEVAMLEVFGPSPSSTIMWLQQVLRKHGGELDAMGKGGNQNTKAADVAAKRLETMYKTATGATNSMRDSLAASGMAGVRDLLTAAYLGSASLAAIPSDLFTKGMWRMAKRLPMAKTGASYVKLLTGLGAAEQRQIAVRSGLLFDSALQANASNLRFFGNTVGPNITRRITDSVMRLNLMNRHTEGLRWVFGTEFMATLGDMKGLNYSELPDGWRNLFGKYGITQEDWDTLRGIELFEQGGVKLLRPNDLRELGDQLGPDRANQVADKFMDALFTERDVAIANTSLRARSTIVGDTQAGTLAGEIMRSFAMFKNFPVTIMQLHVRQMLEQPNITSRIGYGAAFLIGMTMTGALAMQMRQISQGKDPMAMDDPRFWGQATLQGGGLGIYGDFFFKDVNRFGSGITTTVSGAPVSFFGDTLKLTVGNAIQLAQGEDTNAGKELAVWLRRNTPGASLWWARGAMQRILFDNLQKMTDPKAQEYFRNLQKSAYSDYGQQYWWRPGENLPARSPDFSAAGGEQ